MNDNDADDRWLQRLYQAMIEDDIAALEASWIVIRTDPTTGFVSYSGPYDCSSALRASTWEQSLQASWDPAERFDYEVARLVGATTNGHFAPPGGGATF